MQLIKQMIVMTLTQETTLSMGSVDGKKTRVSVFNIQYSISMSGLSPEHLNKLLPKCKSALLWQGFIGRLEERRNSMGELLSSVALRRSLGYIGEMHNNIGLELCRTQFHIIILY